MYRSVRWAFLTVAVSFALVGLQTDARVYGAGAPDDGCAEVLRLPLQDLIQRKADNTFDSAFSTWIGSEEFRHAASASSAGLSVDGIGSLDGKTASSSDAFVKNLRASQQSIATTTKEEIASKILSPFAGDAISAWRECKKQAGATVKHSGMSATIEDYDPPNRTFNLHLSWQGPAALRPKIETGQQLDVKCAKLALPTAKKFFPDSYPEDAVYSCNAHEWKAGQVIIATNAGVQRVRVPEATPRCGPGCDDCRREMAASVCYRSTVFFGSVDEDWKPVTNGGEYLSLVSDGFKGARVKLVLEGKLRVPPSGAHDWNFNAQLLAGPNGDQIKVASAANIKGDRGFAVEMLTEPDKDGVVTARMVLSRLQGWPNLNYGEMSGSSRLTVSRR